MIPCRGPSIWKVPFSDGLACPIAPDAVSPSISAELVFNFPRSVFLTGILLLPIPDATWATYQEQIAQLSLQVTDETNQPVISDSRGTIVGSTNAPVASPLLQLFGRGFHPFALQRPLASLDVWRFTVQNADPVNAQTLAGIFLYFSEPGEEEHA